MGRHEDPSDPGRAPLGPQTPGSSSGISCRKPPGWGRENGDFMGKNMGFIADIADLSDS